MNRSSDVELLSSQGTKFAPFSNTPSSSPSQLDSSLPKMILPLSPSSPSSNVFGKRNSRWAAPRSSKGSGTFDLSAFQKSLPPNTGPGGVTAVTSGAASSANSNKNLSHVPCKFFKQGICQAGKSCPFSHNLDGTSAADKLPCKYFQKGNCKFGLKCALAHCLPDGTRVNTRSSMSFGRNSDRYDRVNPNANLNSSKTSTFSTSSSNFNTSSNFSKIIEPIDIRSENDITTSLHSPEITSPSASRRLFDLQQGSSYRSAPAFLQSHDHGGSYSHSEWSPSYTSNIFSSNLTSNFTGSSFSMSRTSPSGSSFSGLSSVTIEHKAVDLTLKTPSLQTSETPTFSRYHSSTSSSPLVNFNKGLHEESAILDDESESCKSEDETCLEDYVPASLGNLLFTQEEQKRRVSRSQSGTLSVRPNIVSTNSPESRADISFDSKKLSKFSDGVFPMD